MDVTTIPDQGKIIEQAGACSVIALERIPAEIRVADGVSRMSYPKMIKEIKKTVSIPVMAKVRIGHFIEAEILESLKIGVVIIKWTRKMRENEKGHNYDKKALFKRI